MCVFVYVCTAVWAQPKWQQACTSNGWGSDMSASVTSSPHFSGSKDIWRLSIWLERLEISLEPVRLQLIPSFFAFYKYFPSLHGLLSRLCWLGNLSYPWQERLIQELKMMAIQDGVEKESPLPLSDQLLHRFAISKKKVESAYPALRKYVVSISSVFLGKF